MGKTITSITHLKVGEILIIDSEDWSRFICKQMTFLEVHIKNIVQQRYYFDYLVWAVL